MVVTTTEVQVTSSLAAGKLFKFYQDFDTIAPTVDPQTFKAVSVIEGDGGVGSVKSITFGDGVPYTNSKHSIDSIDTQNLSMSYTIFDGDALLGTIDSTTHHINFIPSVEGGCIYKHTTIFNSQTELDEVILNYAKEAFKNTFKAIEAYALVHPDTY